MFSIKPVLVYFDDGRDGGTEQHVIAMQVLLYVIIMMCFFFLHSSYYCETNEKWYDDPVYGPRPNRAWKCVCVFDDKSKFNNCGGNAADIYIKSARCTIIM